MTKKEDAASNNSLRTFIIYGVIVLSIILVALLIRVFSVIRESKFDGQHRFTLAVGQSEKSTGLISFEPESSAISVLTFSNPPYLLFSELNRKVGIIPDGYIKTQNTILIDKSISSLLQSFMLNSNNQLNDITLYDIFQLWLYSNKIPVSTITFKELPTTANTLVFDKTAGLLFRDNSISAENVSIQIINSSGESGMAGRLERVISNIGGNVVSVKTGIKTQKKSTIEYFGRKSYTVDKLKTLLPYELKNTEKESIAEIIITIGENQKKSKLY